MASITPDTQIAAGNNNAAGLALISTLTDSNSIKFVMPRALPKQRRGLRRVQLNHVVTRIGQNSVTMESSVMTVLQYQSVLDTYEGLITIRLALNGITYANYNAALDMPDEADLTYIPNIVRIDNQSDCGPGYQNVNWIVTGLVAL